MKISHPTPVGSLGTVTQSTHSHTYPSRLLMKLYCDHFVVVGTKGKIPVKGQVSRDKNAFLWCLFIIFMSASMWVWAAGFAGCCCLSRPSCVPEVVEESGTAGQFAEAMHSYYVFIQETCICSLSTASMGMLPLCSVSFSSIKFVFGFLFVFNININTLHPQELNAILCF